MSIWLYFPPSTNNVVAFHTTMVNVLCYSYTISRFHVHLKSIYTTALGVLGTVERKKISGQNVRQRFELLSLDY